MIGTKLKDLRLEYNLTQTQLSQKIQCNQSMIARWEKNECEPTESAIIKIANFFDVTTDFLLGREDDFGNVTISSGNVSGNNNTVNSNNVINSRTAAQLTPADSELIKKYHSAPAEIRKAIDKLLS